MNPFIENLLKRYIPILLAALVPVVARWLGAEEAARFVADLSSLVVALVLSGLQTYRSRREKLTAMASAQPLTESELKGIVGAGRAPSVLTPKHEVPVLGTGNG